MIQSVCGRRVTRSMPGIIMKAALQQTVASLADVMVDLSFVAFAGEQKTQQASMLTQLFYVRFVATWMCGGGFHCPSPWEVVARKASGKSMGLRKAEGASLRPRGPA